MRRVATLSSLTCVLGLVGCGGDRGETGTSTTAGTFTTGADATASESGASGADGDEAGSQDGDTGDTESGDDAADTNDDAATGDGDGDGDGDGAGDGDGDGDGDGATGDGDGDGDGDGASTGDGDGDGDGDGATTGDGDGDGDGDGATTGDGDGDGDGDGSVFEPCEEQPPAIEFVPPNLLFVLDKSGSMMSTINGQTYWNILHGVVTDVVTTWQASIDFGAKLFPTNDNPSPLFPPGEGCMVDTGVEVPTAPNNLANILAGIPAADVSITSAAVTPAQDGYDRGSEWLAANHPGETNAIILFMDGVISDGRNGTADCNPPLFPSGANTVQGLLDSITANANNGVLTYIVGFGFFTIDPAVEQEMNDYAEAGGAPLPGTQKFYLATSPQSLSDAMSSIAQEVATCDISVQNAPAFPDAAKVEIDGVEYDQINPADCATQTGWFWSNSPTNTEITLCGGTCDEFKLKPLLTDVNYYCTPA